MIDTFNTAFGWILDVLLYPFQDLGSWLAMILLSLVTALLVLFVYRKTSNQERIRAVKTKILAHMLEILLYKDSLPVTFKAQGNILHCNLKYLAHSVKPMLVLIVPFVLLLIQLDLRFGYESLQSGESILVKLQLKEGIVPSQAEVVLEPTEGLLIDAPPLRIDSEAEINWLLRAREPGVRYLKILVNNQAVTKRIVVGGKPLAKISPSRVSRGWIDQLAYPGESSIVESAEVEKVEIGYPDRKMSILGWQLHWMIVYFALTILFAFSLKGFLKVEV